MTNDRSSQYLLHIEDLYKSYGNKVILDNIDLSVASGELCTLVGPSGCGKSTLLRIILGQETQNRGRIFIDGETAGFPDTRRGIVYQRYSLFPNLTVLENVMLGFNLQHGWRERRSKRAAFTKQAMEYLARVRLEQHAHKYPHELSGGMQQRVAIAQALIMRPKILLMDEPFGALDPQTREDMQLFLLELWEQEKMTIFFVTHDLEEAIYLGTRIFVISRFYSDDRGIDCPEKGAKIVADHQLPRIANSAEIKHNPEFVKLLHELRQAGFDPDFLQHANEFSLKHNDSFQTLTEKEHQR